MLNLLGFLLPLFFHLHGQSALPPHVHLSANPEECGEPMLRSMLYAKEPGKMLAQKRLDLLAAASSKQKDKSGAQAKSADYTLPVVFHIIHQNGPENITDAQVLQALSDLNDAYANVNFYGGIDGVDTKIQFCLARRDPNGNATTGINRVVSPLTDVTFATDIAMKDLIRWNPFQYINIWLVRNIEGGGIAGYAYLPASHGGPEDGIVMLGSIMPNLGGGHSTLVHEMGHYLGLYHTFEGGCANLDCTTDGDLVCDTPPDGTTVGPGDCSAVINSCSTDAQSGFPSDQNDINWNYVDYGNQPCRNGYTQGQADRMAFFIENARQSLLNSMACQDPCLNPIAAGFTPSATVVNIGGTVNFTNTSTGSTIWSWSLNGTPFSSSANASYTFNALGSFEVMLNALNGDPNCSGSASTTIEVVCPVEAVFSTSNLYPAPNQTVNFSNGSTGATSYAWSINGAVVATSANFSHAFPSTGQYNICLEVGNGLCTDQFCQLVFVLTPPSSGDCESSFIKRFGNMGVNEEVFFTLPDGNGNYFICGRDEANSLILQVDPSGNILQQRTYDFTSGPDFVAALMVDSDGYLVGSARDQPNSNTVNIFFKLDWQTGNVVWSKRLDNPAYNRFDGVFQHPQTGNYLHYGATTAAIDDYILELDKNTGNALWQFATDYSGNADVYTHHFTTSNAIYYVGQGRLGGNLDDIRPTLTKFDLNGNLQWAKIHLRSPNQSSRLYNMGTFLENDTIVICGRGSFTNDNLNNSQLYLYKTDLDGDLIWAKSYAVAGGTGTAGYRAHLIPGGYIVQGSYEEPGAIQRFFVARVDKQGNVIWAKKVNTSTSTAGVTKPLTIIDNGFVVFAAQTTQFDGGSNNDLLFGRISLDGQVVGTGCTLIQDINLLANNVSNPYDGLLLPNEYQPSYLLGTNNHNPLAANLADNDLPGCECTEFTPACNETFVTAYGSAVAEEGRVILPVPEGWAFAAAKTDSLIVGLLDESGHLQWQRSMSFSPGLTERTWDLLLTADGHIVGCGSTAEGSLSNWNNFVFKYDYQNQALLWNKVFNFGNGDRSSLINLLELPDGNILVTGDDLPNNGPGLGCDAVWLELNPSNGNTVFLRNYDLGSCETFYNPIFSNDGTAIYATGRYNTAGGGTDKFRAPITKLDLDGNELWTRLYLRSTAQTARLYGVSVIEESAGLFVFGQGDLGGTSTTAVTLQILKTDMQGDILWAKNYDLPGANTESVTEAISVPDGFLVLGNYTQGNQNFFLIKTDKNGGVQWAKSYGGTGAEVAYDMAYQNGQIFIIGKTNSFGNGSEDMLLVKLGLDGEILDNSCNFSADLTPTETAIQNPYDGPHPLTEFTPSYPSTSPNVAQKTPSLTEAQLCFTPCADTCANGLPIHTMPDAALQTISAQCNGDSMLVSAEVCNADSVALPVGTPISFYQNNPTAAAATLLGTVLLTNAVQPGECLNFSLSIPLPANQQLFAIVNDNGSTPTPFNLEDDFPNTATEECDFTNNIASFTVNYAPPVLNLGPDQARCDFQVTELDAGPGFASYQWSVPGNNGQVFTAWQPGTYSVTVTDPCGGTQTDEVTLSVIAATVLEIGMDTAIVCAGDSAQFSVGGFAAYQWFPPDLVDCANCPSVTIAQPVDTCLILVATDGNGCYSTDTVCMTVLQTFAISDTLAFCQGDTVLVFGNPVTMEGTYSMTFQAENGCDSTHTITLISAADPIEILTNAAICEGDVYDFHGTQLIATGSYDYFDSSGTCIVHELLELTVNDSFATTENITICEGDTALVFGVPTTVPGVFSMSFAAQNGCDSMHTITLVVLDAAYTSETITICENQTANIFGTNTNVPGDYEQSFPLPNGCDSTHVITLVVNDTVLVSQSLSICQGDSALIFGNWETQAGIYVQALPLPNGCDSTHIVSLVVLNAANTSETITICENQTANIFGTNTNVPGVYEQSFPLPNGCDSTHVITLVVNDTVLVNQSLSICQGDSALIFANWETQAGIYEQAFPLPNGCDSTHVITLVVIDTVLVNQSLSICQGDSALIFGNWETQAGIYTQVFSTPLGCDSTVAITLAVGTSFQVDFETEIACPLAFDGVATALPSGGLPPYSYEWQGLDTVFVNQLTGLDVGTYYVAVTDASGCQVVDSVEMVAAIRPDVSTETQGVSCFGVNDGKVNILANDPSLQYLLLNTTPTSQTSFDSLWAGGYQYSILDTFGCEWLGFFSVDSPDEILLDLPGTIKAPPCDSVQIEAESPVSPLTWTWIPADFLSCMDCPNPIAYPLSTTTYSLTVVDSNGCSTTDSIVVIVDFDGKAYIPNVFSPNDDGINDVFFVLAGCVKEVKKMLIFDRWGEKVYEASNTPPNDPLYGWNGEFRGKPMNSDVFVYYIIVELYDGTQRTYKGDLTLLR